MEVLGDNNCSLPVLPYTQGNFLQGPEMFLNDKDEVVICGGNAPESRRSCWRLEDGVWNRAYEDLTSNRGHSTGFSMNGKAYMLGGNYVSNTSEILDYSNEE